MKWAVVHLKEYHHRAHIVDVETNTKIAEYMSQGSAERIAAAHNAALDMVHMEAPPVTIVSVARSA